MVFYLCGVDVDTREVIAMKAYMIRNYLKTLDFVKEALKLCVNKREVEVITDKMPCYNYV